MCGIAGIVDPSGAPVDRDLLTAMTRRLVSRGPDGEGFWTDTGVGLGHRRLKIIDLTDAAAQPMTGEGERVHVVFNGEIYNFQELRAELEGKGHVFRSRSDTEVIVHGYEEWGDAVVERIDGMFAFGLWDTPNRRFLAARDRMGKKPFYWGQVSRPGRPPLFVFASELKALLLVPGLDRSLDPAALSRYLTFEYVPPPYTIVRGARKLNSSERLVLEIADPDAVPRVDMYWDLPFPATHRICREEDAAEELRVLLRRAVKRRLVSDVPLGVFLSGGIDSSSVVALMSDEGARGRVKTFSIGFTERSFDETVYARKVAELYGTDHAEAEMGPASVLDILPEVTRFLDEPFGDASVVPTYLLSKFTRGSVTVALGGDGGDELFAGYGTFKADWLAQLLYDRAPEGARAAARGMASRLPARTQYFSLDFKLRHFFRGADATGPRRHQRWLASFLPHELGRLFSPAFRDDVNRAGEMTALDDVDDRALQSPARQEVDLAMDFYCRFYLPGDINVKVDRASSAVGLEVRAPFLDTEVVAFACRLPPSLRLKNLTSKYILKSAMTGLVPDEILHRRKQGFGMPVAPWFKGELQSMLRDELNPAKIRREGFFDPDEITRIVDEHVSGRTDQRKQLWTLFMFERWLANYGAGAPT